MLALHAFKWFFASSRLCYLAIAYGDEPVIWFARQKVDSLQLSRTYCNIFCAQGSSASRLGWAPMGAAARCQGNPSPSQELRALPLQILVNNRLK